MILTISLVLIPLWMLLESPSLSLLCMIAISGSQGFLLVGKGLWDVPIYILVLSLMGGLFILLGMIIMSFPKDYDVIFFSKKVIGLLSISLVVWAGFYEEGSFNLVEFSPFFSWPYSVGFIFSIFLLLLSLFLVDFFVGGGMEGGFFKID